ncbi:MAG: hypothetical protein JXA42_16170 [Anaerolineales bacterium]|nr:hypothetical protein [Anaerolineales bacterium]
MDSQNASDYDLTGLIDIHIHTAPDRIPRLVDDIQAASQAAEAGMKAIMIKSHHTLTSDRAFLAGRILQNIRVFGGLVLNSTVGGLNVTAVEAALEMGARSIWMPTHCAMNARRRQGLEGGISLFTKDGELDQELWGILDLIHQYDAILATGHISIDEILALFQMVLKCGLRKFVVTHPDSPLIGMPLDVQDSIAYGPTCFERCFVDTTDAVETRITIQQIAAAIRAVGPKTTVLSTDLGQMCNPLPVDGMRFYLIALGQEGLDTRSLRLMTCDNPSRLLDL